MILSRFDKTFDTKKVLRLLGAKRGKTPSPSALRRIDNVGRKMDSLLHPRLDFRNFPLVRTDGKDIELADGTLFTSPKLARAVGDADEIFCFVATVGPEIDWEIQKRMKERRYADAYVLDAIGSIAVENIVEQFYQETAEKAAQQERGVTLRFSPGYCDWSIDQQRILFSVFHDKYPVDVRLSESFLMSPRKSVSGIFGVLPAGNSGVNPAYNPCAICRKNDCIARRSH